MSLSVNNWGSISKPIIKFSNEKIDAMYKWQSPLKRVSGIGIGVAQGALNIVSSIFLLAEPLITLGAGFENIGGAVLQGIGLKTKNNYSALKGIGQLFAVVPEALIAIVNLVYVVAGSILAIPFINAGLLIAPNWFSDKMLKQPFYVSYAVYAMELIEDTLNLSEVGKAPIISAP